MSTTPHPHSHQARLKQPKWKHLRGPVGIAGLHCQLRTFKCKLLALSRSISSLRVDIFFILRVLMPQIHLFRADLKSRISEFFFQSTQREEDKRKWMCIEAVESLSLRYSSCLKVDLETGLKWIDTRLKTVLYMLIHMTHAHISEKNQIHLMSCKHRRSVTDSFCLWQNGLSWTEAFLRRGWILFLCGGFLQVRHMHYNMH